MRAVIRALTIAALATLPSLPVANGQGAAVAQTNRTVEPGSPGRKSDAPVKGQSSPPSLVDPPRMDEPKTEKDFPRMDAPASANPPVKPSPRPVLPKDAPVRNAPQ